MKANNIVIICATAAVGALLALGAAGCKGKKSDGGTLEIKPVNGTIESPLAGERAPQSVVKALLNVSIDDRFENILDENSGAVKIWNMLRCDAERSSEGFGIVAEKGSTTTTFPNVRHGNNPRAYYDESDGSVWVIGSASEGTGVLIEQPYKLRFGDDDKAAIAATIDPYDLQQKLCERVSYSVEGNQVSLYADSRQLTTVVCSVTDMGDIYEDAVWIGEQISYDFDGQNLIAKVTPGLSFNTGKVLNYDDLPTLKLPMTLTDDGFELGDISLDIPTPDAHHGHDDAAPATTSAPDIEGSYFDENNDPNLIIKRRDDGRYDVEIGIFRLTTLDDGVGEMTPEGLRFTATDANGNPISGIITRNGNDAVVVFTDSSWGYIHNGDSFTYAKK